MRMKDGMKDCLTAGASGYEYIERLSRSDPSEINMHTAVDVVGDDVKLARNGTACGIYCVDIGEGS